MNTIKIILFLLTLFMASATVASSGGTHFIVLIDDSKDFKTHIPRIKKTLPDILFYGVQKTQNIGVALPTYKPGTDHLSLVFFGLPQSPQKCQRDRLSVLPEYLFHWETVPSDLDKQKFENFLSQVAKNECRFQSKVSPIVTAESLILPFAQSKLEPDLYFSRTVLLLLSNNAYNNQHNPANELKNYLYKEVKDKAEALDLINQVTQVFRITRDQQGIFTVHTQDSSLFLAGGRDDNPQLGGYPLVYRMSEFHPSFPDVSATLGYSQQIKLDRLAISDQALQLVPVDGEKSTSLGIKMLASARPDSVQLKFADDQENPWKMGQDQFSLEKIVMLNNCAVCSENEEGTRYLPFFKVMTPTLSLNKTDDLPNNAQINFKLKFRYYSNGIYDHHLFETDWHRIEITIADPLEISAATFFPHVVLDNPTLLKQWTASDVNGLTQEAARQRIESWRDKVWLMTLIISTIFLIISGTILFIWLHRRYSEYPFEPALQWIPRHDIKMDFNQQPGNRLLIGTLTLTNEGTVPWLMYLLEKPSQPHRQATLSLTYEALEKHGLLLNIEIAPLGFDVEKQAQLSRQITQMVTDESNFKIFLDSEAISDFEPDESMSLSIKGWFEMTWDNKSLQQEIALQLELMPERATPPRVTYRPIEEKCHFELEQKVLVGTLNFASGARHRFADPFQDYFTVKAFRQNFEIESKVIVIEGDKQLTVLPLQTNYEKKVYIQCDGHYVPNPDFPSKEYAFRLDGEFAAHSELGPHSFKLFRDKTQADIALTITQFNHDSSIYWGKEDGQPRVQGENSEPLADNIFKLKDYGCLHFDEESSAEPLFEIKIGNTGKSGEGSVKVAINVDVKISDDAVRAITPGDGYELFSDLIQLIDRTHGTFIMSSDSFEIKEGEEAKTCAVRLDTTIIKDIVGARLVGEHALTVVIKLYIKIIDDSDLKTSRQITLHNTVGLENLPHPNWLCIYFGTSAITVAIGRGDKMFLLPLQKVKENEDNEYLNLADYDMDNLEKNSKFLLPSYVACDADLRRGDNPDSSVKPGFPAYNVGEELPRPGEPQFLSLPATMTRIAQESGRIIFSLKSWLSLPSNNSHIQLQEMIEYRSDNNKPMTRMKVPLEETVESGFAALVEAYIKVFPNSQVGRVVICHPNTFSDWHQERLHTIVAKALGQRLNIALPYERIQLLSESDAVANYYCRQRMAQPDYSPPKSEHILVYDFGAGTIDLSLVYVEWNQEKLYPKYWHVKNSLGVPIAGNHLDSILARLIDESLKDSKVLNPELFNYRYPVVGESWKKDEEDEYRPAIIRLWIAIRKTKQQENSESIPTWGKQDNNPFCVKVGELSGGVGVVWSDEGKEGFNEFLDASDEAPSEGRHIWSSHGDLYLCIPANEVHDYKPMREFIEFITEIVPTELVNGAEISKEKVNTVVISGRGALWPGLRDKIWAQFPNAKPDDFLRNSQTAKEAVVRGAIARQVLHRKTFKTGQPRPAQLGIFLDDEKRLIKAGDNEWKTGIDLSNTEFFTLVQFALTDPHPRSDFDSWNKHFYIKIATHRREKHWADDPTLIVKEKITPEGKKTITFENTDGHGSEGVEALGSVGQAPTRPPWPIGEILLAPA